MEIKYFGIPSCLQILDEMIVNSLEAGARKLFSTFCRLGISRGDMYWPP